MIHDPVSFKSCDPIIVRSCDPVGVTCRSCDSISVRLCGPVIVESCVLGYVIVSIRSCDIRSATEDVRMIIPYIKNFM